MTQLQRKKNAKDMVTIAEVLVLDATLFWDPNASSFQVPLNQFCVKFHSGALGGVVLTPHELSFPSLRKTICDSS